MDVLILYESFLVGTFCNGSFLVGTFCGGSFLVWMFCGETFLVGTFLVGTFGKYINSLFLMQESHQCCCKKSKTVASKAAQTGQILLQNTVKIEALCSF